MCLLNTSNPDIARTLANVTEALHELAVHPDSPVAFLHEATVSVEVPVLARLVRENSQARREAAAHVARRFAAKGEPLFPAIAALPVCPACRNRRAVIVAVDEWGEEITAPCPACVRDDHDLRQFA